MQLMKDQSFRPFRHASNVSWFDSTKLLPQPPIIYPTKQITTRMYLFHGSCDSVSDPIFLEKMVPPSTKLINISHYGHLDFLYATDAPIILWPQVIQMLKTHL